MKIFKILLVTAIAFGMMACNNEDVPQIENGPEATVSVRVVPTSNGPSVRLTGDLSGDGIIPAVLAAESAIKSLEVWVFVGDALEAYKSATIADGAVPQVLDIEVTSGPRTIVVVANASLDTQATLTELKELTKDLTQDVANGLVMTAEPISVNLVAGKNQYGFADGIENYVSTANQLSATALPLVRVNARVAIVAATLSANLPTDQVAIFDALTDIQVAMFNVPNETKLFGDLLATNADFQYGVQWPSSDLSYVGANESPAAPNALLVENTLTLPAFTTPTQILIENTDAPYFYVTENTATDDKEQMLIVLRGKPTKGGVPVVAQGLYTDADGYTYYPVWVNATKTGYSYTGDNIGDSKIRRNTQYNISLTINGIGNPTIDPVEEAFLDVNVSVEDWKVVNQNVVW